MKFIIFNSNVLKNMILLLFVLLIQVSFCYNDEFNSLPINISQENQLNQIATQFNPNRIQLPNSFNLNNNPRISSDSNILNSFLMQNEKIINSNLNQNSNSPNDILGRLQNIQFRNSNNNGINNIFKNNQNPDLLKYIQFLSQLNVQDQKINNGNDSSINLNQASNNIDNVNNNQLLLIGQALKSNNLINLLKNINDNNSNNNIISPESQHNLNLINGLLNNNLINANNIMLPLTNNNNSSNSSNINLNFLQSLLKNQNQLKRNDMDLSSIGILDNLKINHLNGQQVSSINNIIQNSENKYPGNQNNNNNNKAEDLKATGLDFKKKNLRKRNESENDSFKRLEKKESFKQIEPKQKADFSYKLKEELNQLKELTKEADNIITDKKGKPNGKEGDKRIETKEDEANEQKLNLVKKEIKKNNEDKPSKISKNSHEAVLFEQEFEEKLSYLIDKLDIINRITK